METATASSFGKMLRQLRREADLTQEALAERAGLSTRAVSDLERGVKQAPHDATVEMLADALDLSVEQRERLRQTVSRRRRLPGGAIPASQRLPAEPSPFFGREREEGEARRLLHWGELRLLTLTGPGGVGKTRLALRLAVAAAGDRGDRVLFVPLAAADSAERVIALVASALDLKEQRDRALVEVIAEHLGPREMLLVLDNFEHVMEAAPMVADLLGACHQLRVLVTSRAPLRLRSEQVLEVPPLEMPDPAVRSAAAALVRYPALALFLERARAVRSDFRVDDDGARTVAEICRRLDGLPLAIELAASRIKLTSPEALLRQLDRSLTVLTDGPRDLPLRQQTMRDTILWSYNLLGDDERAAFRRLAVFVGGFDREAAECLLRDGPPGEMALPRGVHGDAGRVLDSLVENSLLRHSTIDGESSYEMLETVRQLGLELLDLHGETMSARRAHAEHFLDVGRRANDGKKGPEQVAWAGRLDRAQPNLRSALRFLRDSGELDGALRLAGCLGWHWEMRGNAWEGEEWTEELLNAAGDAAAPHAVARCAFVASRFALLRGDMDRARRRGEQALHAYQAAGDPAGAASALNLIGGLAHYRTDYREADRYFRESLDLYRNLDDAWGMTQVLINRGILASQEARFSDATDLFAEALALARKRDDRAHIGGVLGNLALAELRQGHLGRAVELNEESIAVRTEIGDNWGVMVAQCNLGEALRMSGRLKDALEPLRAALRFAAAEGMKIGIMHAVEALGEVAHDRELERQAVMMFGAAGKLREEIGMPIGPSDRVILDPMFTSARRELGDQVFDAMWQSGRELPLDAVVGLGLGDEAAETAP